MPIRESIVLLALLWSALTGATALAQEQASFSWSTWELEGDLKIELFEGREALRLRNGSASLADMEFENGTVEYDVRTSGHRSFVGLGFRIEGDHREDFYLRPHNSGRFDAMQYTPVYHGFAGWQLYPEHNASFQIPTDRWIHVRVVVAGPQLEVFFDGSKQPTLSVPRLMRGRSRGALRLWARFPESGTLDLFPTAFSNVVVHKDEAPYEYPEEELPASDSGLIAHWEVSAAFSEPKSFEQAPSGEGWKRATADAKGRLNLARWVEPHRGNGRTAVLARVQLEAGTSRVVRLGFGFSDRATIYLNGQPVFRGDNTFRSRSERYLGVMRVDNDVLYLPLTKGRNELLFAVSEAFGGWGLTARLIDQDGIAVRWARAEGSVPPRAESGGSGAGSVTAEGSRSSRLPAGP